MSIPQTTPAPTATPAPPAAVETVQQNLADARTVAEAPDVVAAKALLTPLVPGAQAGIERRKLWRAAPVEPKPDDTFPRHESVDTLLIHARKQQLSGVPTECAQPFERARNDVESFLADNQKTETILKEIPTLSAAACQRPDHFRAANRWPQDCRVERMANMLGGMANVGEDMLNDAASRLATALEAVLRWSRGAKAAGVREERPWHRATDPDPQQADIHIPLPHARYRDR